MKKRLTKKFAVTKSGKNGAVVGRKTVLDQVKESFTTQLPYCRMQLMEHESSGPMGHWVYSNYYTLDS